MIIKIWQRGTNVPVELVDHDENFTRGASSIAQAIAAGDRTVTGTNRVGAFYMIPVDTIEMIKFIFGEGTPFYELGHTFA